MYTKTNIKIETDKLPDTENFLSMQVRAHICVPCGPDAESEDRRQMYLESIQDIAELSASEIQARIADIDLEAIRGQAEALIAQWGEAAGQLRLLNDALEVRRTADKRLGNTGNKWMNPVCKRPGATFEKHISNKVFRAEVVICVNPHSKNPWRVAYAVHPNLEDAIPVTVGELSFRTKEETDEYTQQRMKALEKEFFYDMDPVIPAIHRRCFLVKGVEIPGFKYEKS